MKNPTVSLSIFYSIHSIPFSVAAPFMLLGQGEARPRSGGRSSTPPDIEVRAAPLPAAAAGAHGPCEELRERRESRIASGVWLDMFDEPAPVNSVEDGEGTRCRVWWMCHFGDLFIFLVIWFGIQRVFQCRLRRIKLICSKLYPKFFINLSILIIRTYSMSPVWQGFY